MPTDHFRQPERITTPRIIPVLDLLNGQVVRAIGGRRSEYRPLVSSLTTKTDPMELALAMLTTVQGNELYVADLDSIQRQGNNYQTALQILGIPGVKLWIDVGIGGPGDIDRLPRSITESSEVTLVIGSETLSNPENFLLSANQVQARLAFSIDLRQGQVLRPGPPFANIPADNCLPFIESIDNCLNPTAFLVIDLSRVGEGRGPGTEEFCRALHNRWPERELIVGGGIRDWHDVKRLGDCGATGVLVSTSLHDRTLIGPNRVS